MIARTHRFHGHASVRAVYKQGGQVRGALLSLKHSTRQGDKPYRAAVVVSRKVSKSAVVRNRIRRRVYEIVRLYQPVAGNDVVLTIFGEQLATMSPAELQTQVIALLEKASITSVNRATIEPINAQKVT